MYHRCHNASCKRFFPIGAALESLSACTLCTLLSLLVMALTTTGRNYVYVVLWSLQYLLHLHPSGSSSPKLKNSILPFQSSTIFIVFYAVLCRVMAVFTVLPCQAWNSVGSDPLCAWCLTIPSGRWLLAPGGHAHSRAVCPAADGFSLSAAGECIGTILCSRGPMMRDDRLLGTRQRLLMRRSIRIIAIIISWGFCAYQMHLCCSPDDKYKPDSRFPYLASKRQRSPFRQTKGETLSIYFLWSQDPFSFSK